MVGVPGEDLLYLAKALAPLLYVVLSANLLAGSQLIFRAVVLYSEP